MLFNFIFFIYSLAYLPYLILTGRWYKGYWARLGFFPTELKKSFSFNTSIWIHAVSVGEITAISGLVDQIKSRWPKETLVVTTTTKTGYALAQTKFKDKAIVLASPLDFTWVVASFIRLINPKIYIVAETEIWPNLYQALHQRGIPIVMINGRISDVSYNRYQLIKSLLKKALDYVSCFCMQGDEDARRIIELGAFKDKVLNLGNIKFDDMSLAQEVSMKSISYQDRPVWVAGSTHPGEEEIILKIFSRYQSSWSLVIAPRHVERSEQIANLINAHGFKTVWFSQLSSSKLSEETVILVDTIGSLRSLYAKASFVFVGKSLCVGGGHNIIEPALYAKPIIIGPYMQNFRDITAAFNIRKAIIQVKDKEEFQDQVDHVMNDAVLRKQLGERALEVVRSNQGALNRTLKILEKYL